MEPGAQSWFTAVLDRTGDDNAFLTAYAGAPRRLRASEGAWESARGTSGAQELGWSAARTARVVLLERACGQREVGARAELVDRLFRTGDNDERIALLGALSRLPDPAAYLETAIEACRTNVEPVFAAIACENDYPAKYFPEPAFNQMVLKAVFIGVSLGRVEGLGQRLGEELSRMAAHYADERRAAGRSVPEDLALIMRTQ